MLLLVSFSKIIKLYGLQNQSNAVKLQKEMLIKVSGAHPAAHFPICHAMKRKPAAPKALFLVAQDLHLPDKCLLFISFFLLPSIDIDLASTIYQAPLLLLEKYQ